MAYLADVHELFDASGMASTRLSAAVGYPGSSVAFAQLLSGMERSGLIEREVRGKRTYRISLGLMPALGPAQANESCGADGLAEPAVLAESAVLDGPGGIGGRAGAGGGAGMGGGAGAGGFDYDELARRLLVQVVRRLAAAEPGTGSLPGRAALAGSAALAGDANRAGTATLRDAVVGLEYELASVWAEHGKLAEENARLREQLEATRRSLELTAERLGKLPIAADLDRSEVVLLQQLLSAGGSGGARSAGRDGQVAAEVNAGGVFAEDTG